MAPKSLDEPERRALLGEMKVLEPDSDLSPDAITRVFLPLPEHRRVLDDRVVLVLGDHGVGKSALFHFLQTPKGAHLFGLDVASSASRRTWTVGFSETGTEHAPPVVLEKLADGAGPVEEKIRKFWLGHLIGRIAIAEHGVAIEPPPFVTKWKENPAAPAHWLPALGDVTVLVSWLDQLERALAEQDRTLVVTYDHLDRIGVRSRDVRRRVLPPLLALWLSFSNRYRRIRAKIFLRRDLFDESVANTADVSKLLARAQTLRWSVPALYRLLVRHLAAHDGLRGWLTSGKWKLPLTEHDLLGWMPPEDLPEEGNPSQAMLMAHIVGERMGMVADPTSEYSWTWVPNHLKDAHGVIVPRSMITLFKRAALRALRDTPGARHMCLLAPEELRVGLHETSERHVSEVREENPVIQRLALLKDIRLPAPVREVVAAFSRGPEEDDDFGNGGERILDELTRLGAVDLLPKGRVDIPDIYRLSFKIERKGQKIVSGS